MCSIHSDHNTSSNLQTLYHPTVTLLSKHGWIIEVLLYKTRGSTKQGEWEQVDEIGDWNNRISEILLYSCFKLLINEEYTQNRLLIFIRVW